MTKKKKVEAEVVEAATPVFPKAVEYVAPTEPQSLFDAMLNALKYARDKRNEQTAVWMPTVDAAIAAAEQTPQA